MFALIACGGAERYELGQTRSNRERRLEPDEGFYTSKEAFMGFWLGQATDPLALGAEPGEPAPIYAFPSGSSQIALEIRETPEGGLGGILTFGDGVPPPPATDPDVGYPEGVSYEDLLAYDDPESERGALFLLNYDYTFPPFEGFPYPIESSFVELTDVPDGVLHMIYSTSSFLDPWCALQTPVAWPDDTYHPLPYAATGMEFKADGLNDACALYGEPDLSACPANLEELTPDDHLDAVIECVASGPIIAELSCDKVFLSQFCDCGDTQCAAVAEVKSLTLRVFGGDMVGAFDNALFKNPRGLSTPIGPVLFQRVAE